jgi:uncharacterized protein YkwD
VTHASPPGSRQHVAPISRAAGLAAAVTATLALATGLPAAAAPARCTGSVQLHELVNAARADAGHGLLQAESTADDWACSWSARMESSGRLEHSGGSWALEVVGVGASVRDVFDTWMASPSHRASVLDDYSAAQGAAAVYDAGRDVYWVTAEFVGAGESVPPAPTPPPSASPSPSSPPPSHTGRPGPGPSASAPSGVAVGRWPHRKPSALRTAPVAGRHAGQRQPSRQRRDRREAWAGSPDQLAVGSEAASGPTLPGGDPSGRVSAMPAAGEPLGEMPASPKTPEPRPGMAVDAGGRLPSGLMAAERAEHPERSGTGDRRYGGWVAVPAALLCVAGLTAWALRRRRSLSVGSTSGGRR